MAKGFDRDEVIRVFRNYCMQNYVSYGLSAGQLQFRMVGSDVILLLMSHPPESMTLWRENPFARFSFSEKKWQVARSEAGDWIPDERIAGAKLEELLLEFTILYGKQVAHVGAQNRMRIGAGKRKHAYRVVESVAPES